MNKYIKPPALSTNFSESGKNAKKRFENILNTKANKTGAFAFVLMLIIISTIGVLFAFNSNNNAFLHGSKGYSYNIPQSWENKYEIEEDDSIVYIYHKAIREKYGEGTGLLFYIEMLPSDNLTHDDITDPGNRIIGLQGNGYTYVFGMPTDVQYPIWEGGDRTLARDYTNLTKDLDRIKKNMSFMTRSGGIARLNGTAIITKDTTLYEDSQCTASLTSLQENDLVYVIYRQDDNSYYIQLAYMSSPSVQGYVENDVISFETNLMENANYGSVISKNIYKSPNENDIYQANFTTVLYLAGQKDEWTKVNLIGRDDVKWVKTVDISYELISYNTDLSY